MPPDEMRCCCPLCDDAGDLPALWIQIGAGVNARLLPVTDAEEIAAARAALAAANGYVFAILAYVKKEITADV